MGWASGSQLAEEIWKKFKKYIPEEDHQQMTSWLYGRFCDEDADDWSSKKGELWSVAEPGEWKEYIEE